MMKQKLFAILSAMACAASCMMGTAVFAEDAEPYPAFAVIGVDNEEAPEKYIILDIGGGCYPRYISAAELAPFMSVDAEAPKYGDILEVRTGYCEEPLAATAAIYFDGVASNNEIFRLYSLFDTENTEVFTVDGLEFGTNFPILTAQDGAESIYANDFLRSYVQPGSVDMRDLKKGDEVTMYVVNGNPVVPVSASPLGDANGDGTLDVLDVIVLNQYALGGGALPAARSAGSNRADFNGDGVVDGTDSLCVMKRIVGLEEAAE